MFTQANKRPNTSASWLWFFNSAQCLTSSLWKQTNVRDRSVNKGGLLDSWPGCKLVFLELVLNHFWNFAEGVVIPGQVEARGDASDGGKHSDQVEVVVVVVRSSRWCCSAHEVLLCTLNRRRHVGDTAVPVCA